MISPFPRVSNRLKRLSFTALLAAALSACTITPHHTLRPTPEETRLIPPDITLTMSDGAHIPLRTYPAATPPKAIILALHGYADSRDAWEFLAPPLNNAGITLIAPDQRGFGQAPAPHGWSSTSRMVRDAQEQLRWLHEHHPTIPLYIMGESMGGATALLISTNPPPGLTGTILLAPAIMSIGEPWQATLNTLDLLAPDWRLSASAVPGERIASDNYHAMRRMYFDPLTQHSSTLHPLTGLTHLMQTANKAAPNAHTPLLLIFGGRDQFVLPPYTASLIRRLPNTTRLDELPTAHHLLSRDRRATAQDIISWVFTPSRPLPSGGDIAAALWVATAPE